MRTGQVRVLVEELSPPLPTEAGDEASKDREHPTDVNADPTHVAISDLSQQPCTERGNFCRFAVTEHFET